MKFKEGTPIYTVDDEKLGTIERFVVDPQGQEIVGLVVRKGFFFKEDRVIPIKNIQSTSEDRVVLHANVNSVEEFPLFEEKHFIEPDPNELGENFPAEYAGSVYYYPPYGGVSWYNSGIYPVALNQPTVTERNIPEGTVPLKEGAKVISRDSKHVGDVQKIYTSAESNRITHFSITQGMLFKEEKLMPVDWVKHVMEDEIHLAVSASTLEKLQDF